ncbi:putative helicase superfamily c-terminal domain [Lyophyllum shimeji]|uniref:DNA 3'-5' helicase n=1 Tax=Lyophyllum shimeji TaxID=47721 RepID=A0A9P3PFN7_LYOSH|nr:putative helicase superfamily c-terminal domain [Lyophyllum shimeji]
MPLLFNNEKITVVVTALNLIGEQLDRQVQAAGLTAVSVTAENNSKETFLKIQKGKYRIVTINPEIVLQRDGFCKKLLWSHKTFMSKIFNITFDEGHCICQWGSTFRPEYKQVGSLRFLAPGIPFYVTSATIPPSMMSTLKETLHISPSSCTVSQRSNDRHNIAFDVQKMKYPINSYEDLAFLIPKNWKEGDPPPRKFMVFFDSKREAEKACQFLRNRAPEVFKENIKWFHAGMTTFFRSEELDSFKKGELWGLGMTDVGGMGIDISDVLTVVQWRAPKDLNILMQRFGRAARDFSLQGVAILIAEPKWFLDEYGKKGSRKRKRAAKKSTNGSSRKNQTPGSSNVTPDSDGSESSDSDGDAVPARQNSQPARVDGGDEALSDIDDAIRSIESTATRKGKKQKRTTDNAMRFFINARSLRGRKRCRRFHLNRFYKNSAIPTPAPCCDRCKPKVPKVCCDLCDPDRVKAMINERDDERQPATRGSSSSKRPSLALTHSAQQLHAALHRW